jgi:hypothetical protein
MKFWKLILVAAALFVIAPRIIAENNTCPEVVQKALRTTDQLCSQIGRNQACYGNVRLEAKALPSIKDFTFEKQGDLVNIANLRKLDLSPFDQTKSEWGVALMRLQANLPDTLPGQNVTFLMFGDVEITNAVSSVDETLKPMQAFYFRSGIGDAPCAEAPDSGLLIQTPHGTDKVHLTVNGASLELGSTAYLQAQPSHDMIITVVEGAAIVTALDETRIVPAGGRVRVPLKPDLTPAGKPGEVEPYDVVRLQALPLLILPIKIQLAKPLVVEGVSTAGKPGGQQLEVGECSKWPPLKAGQVVTFQHGIGFSKNAQEAERQRRGHSAAIVVDNVPLAVYYEGITFHDSGLFGDRARADWTATPGTHTVTSVWTHPNEPMDTCVFTVR